MQLSATITGREFDVAASAQAPAVGSAMHAAVAVGSRGGGYDSIQEAAAAMARPHVRTYRPDESSSAVYKTLYDEYRRLHDYFGRGTNDVMKTLRALRDPPTETACGGDGQPATEAPGAREALTAGGAVD
jgi:L-ribulokinase